MKQIKEFYDKNTATFSYILYDDEALEAAIIDSVLDFDYFSGKISYESADKLISFVENNDLNVRWILETHIHADHLTAANYLKHKFKNAKTAISEKIVDVLKFWSGFFDDNQMKLDGSDFDMLLGDGEVIRVGNMEVKLMETHGHTPACSCFVVEDCVFVGDVIFMPDVGTARTDFPGGSAEESYESLQKIFALGDNIKIYTAHDYPPNGREISCVSTVLQQKQENILAKSSISKGEFIKIREARDENKEIPRLLYPSLQVNLRAGKFSENESGKIFLKLPISKK